MLGTRRAKKCFLKISWLYGLAVENDDIPLVRIGEDMLADIEIIAGGANLEPWRTSDGELCRPAGGASAGEAESEREGGMERQGKGGGGKKGGREEGMETD